MQFLNLYDNINLKNKIKNLIPLIIISILPFLFELNCTNPTSPPPTKEEPPKAIKLNLLDVSCTEAFIKVTASDTVLPANITLKKDENALFNFTLTKTDTVVIDTTLEPGKTYTYQTVAQIKGTTEKSDTLQVKSLNITSNNYNWQKYYFGDGASSIINDIAIIDENNIWAVGKIYMNDSTGKPGPHAYNAIHWNGLKWKLYKFQFYTFCGQSSMGSYPASAIFVLNDSLIVISSASQLTYVEEEKQIKTECIPISISINKIWGNSSHNFYLVGNNGNIVHYQHGQWIKIESGTNLNIHDINGFFNQFTGKTEILCVADDPNFQGVSQVISIDEDNTTKFLNSNGIGIAISSIWFKPGIQYYIVGNGLYEKTYKHSASWVDLNKNRSITSNFMETIRGNGFNDIIVAGAFGEIIHFNGLQWKSLKQAATELSHGEYYRVAVKGNMVAAAGYNQNQGVILIGHHL